MDIRTNEAGGNCEIFISGRLDSTTAPEAETELMASSEKYNKIVLDLSELEYLSSAGLRVLKKLHVAMKKKTGDLSIVNVQPLVMEVFEMTGFAGLLNII